MWLWQFKSDYHEQHLSRHEDGLCIFRVRFLTMSLDLKVLQPLMTSVHLPCELLLRKEQNTVICKAQCNPVISLIGVLTATF